jgi:hypothetical protein
MNINGQTVSMVDGYDEWCLATANIVVTEGNAAFFEVELTMDSNGGDMSFMLGAVRPGLDHDQQHQYSDGAHFLYAYSGSLYGSGKNRSEGHGALAIGDKVGILIDLMRPENSASDNGAGARTTPVAGGTVSFFVNGERFGPGFEGASGPLVLGVQMEEEGQCVTLLC